MIYKKIDLFGNEETVLIEKKKKVQTSLEDYDGFVEKFEAKKTTDDCYTPVDVFNLVLEFVSENCNISECEIIRPFFPNGDYQSIEYKEKHVVIDNPPFSIISQICKFYIENKIKFFLFAPHLTNFTSDLDMTHVICGVDVVYENKAVVKTSFLTNMLGDVKIIGVPDLHKKIKNLYKNSSPLPKYVYPINVLTVSDVAYCVEKGIGIKIMKSEAKHVRCLESQKKHKKTIFGSGFLISDKAAAERAAAERAAAERAAAERAAAERAAAERENFIVWELSEKEKEQIKLL